MVVSISIINDQPDLTLSLGPNRLCRRMTDFGSANFKVLVWRLRRTTIGTVHTIFQVTDSGMEAAVKFGFGPSPFCSAKNLTQDERERER